VIQRLILRPDVLSPDFLPGGYYRRDLESGLAFSSPVSSTAPQKNRKENSLMLRALAG
jgi:hypothetical protein